MRVIVCGGRDYADALHVVAVMKALEEEAVVITGGARGADTLAHNAALALGLKTEVYIANWAQFGRRAGILRNTQMLETGCDRVVAFRGGRGTENMVSQAEGRGIPVFRV